MKTRKLCAMTALIALTLTGCDSTPKPLTPVEDAIEILREDVYGGSNLPPGEIQLTMQNACKILQTGKDGGMSFEFASEVYAQALKDYFEPMQAAIVVGYSVRSTCPELAKWAGIN